MATTDSNLGARDIRAVGYFFAEDSSLTYGLQVDLARFSANEDDPEVLFRRFHSRLISEYDRLAPKIAKSDAARGAMQGPEQEAPISIEMLTDDVIFLRIVPTAIERDMLLRQLSEKLMTFVRLLKETTEA